MMIIIIIIIVVIIVILCVHVVMAIREARRHVVHGDAIAGRCGGVGYSHEDLGQRRVCVCVCVYAWVYIYI